MHHTTLTELDEAILDEPLLCDVDHLEEGDEIAQVPCSVLADAIEITCDGRYLICRELREWANRVRPFQCEDCGADCGRIYPI